jgi:hypothetical protein
VRLYKLLLMKLILGYCQIIVTIFFCIVTNDKFFWKYLQLKIYCFICKKMRLITSPRDDFEVHCITKKKKLHIKIYHWSQCRRK